MVAEQYSSFQIGKLLHVSRQAVNQWIDKGYIHSYRTPGGHRRVRREDLIDFLRDQQIPLPHDLDRSAPPANLAPDIMIVDDEEDFLLILARAVRDGLPRAHVRTYRNGLDALVAIGAQRPDLLILDLVMPKIDGLEVCRRLKLNEFTRGLPIMIVTAHDIGQIRDQLAALNVVHCCGKHQPSREIVGCVLRVFPAPAAVGSDAEPLDQLPTAV